LLTGFTHFVLLKISKIAYRAVVLPPSAHRLIRKRGESAAAKNALAKPGRAL
jgi:hypothetical protein